MWEKEGTLLAASNEVMSVFSSSLLISMFTALWISFSVRSRQRFSRGVFRGDSLSLDNASWKKKKKDENEKEIILINQIITLTSKTRNAPPTFCSIFYITLISECWVLADSQYWYSLSNHARRLHSSAVKLCKTSEPQGQRALKLCVSNVHVQYLCYVCQHCMISWHKIGQWFRLIR